MVGCFLHLPHWSNRCLLTPGLVCLTYLQNRDQELPPAKSFRSTGGGHLRASTCWFGGPPFSSGAPELSELELDGQDDESAALAAESADVPSLILVDLASRPFHDFLYLEQPLLYGGTWSSGLPDRSLTSLNSGIQEHKVATSICCTHGVYTKSCGVIQ